MSSVHIKSFQVDSPSVSYTDDEIVSEYTYKTTRVSVSPDGSATVRPVDQTYKFKTDRRVPKLGVMLVGWGGNNGTTVTAGILANKKGLSWETKEGLQHANYYGSLTQSSTFRVGNIDGQDVWAPMKALLPMVDPSDIVLDGWDISGMNLGDAMRRSKVLEPTLQAQVREEMSTMVPRRSIYYPEFIAANQGDRADNVLPGTSKQSHLEQIRKDIRDFRKNSEVDKVVILWTANTERFTDVTAGVNDTADNILAAVRADANEIAPSTIFALAAILEGCPFINGSPQNTLVPGVVDLAIRHDVQVSGDDFKSGQTKMKSVLVDFLVSAGLKVTSIASYNHLGNNDGMNLSAPEQFRSKEISKSNVVDDMVASNRILYREDEHPDHTVVIKYMPYVGDSKRAMDEYTSEIFLGGRNTIAMHNTCEDSLLASPLIIDLVVLAELSDRISYSLNGSEFAHFHPVNSLLSFLLKAPMVPQGTPVINALARQRSCIENVFKACVGLPPESNMALENRSFRGVPATERAAQAVATKTAATAPVEGEPQQKRQCV